MGTRVGSITFGGLASGIKSDELISKLLELERRPVDLLEERKATQSSRLDILRDLNTKTLRLRDALRGLDNRNLVGTGPSVDEEFSRLGATSSNEAVAVATASAGATPGQLDVRVQQLASASRHVSAEGFSALTNTVGTGTFKIDVGNKTTNLTIDSTNNTVQGFVDAINASDADVTAFVLNDGSGTPLRIVIQGNSTGDANDVVLTNGLTGGTPQSPAFTETRDANDAIVIVDPDPDDPDAGIEVHSSTNSFEDLIQGVSLTTRSVNDPDDPADVLTITVDTDRPAIATAVKDLVSAFNEIGDVIRGQFKIDAKTNRGGPLIGDSTLTALQQRLARIVASEIGEGSISKARQLGLSLDSSGKLSLDETKLGNALAANFSGVRAFFAGSASSFASQLRDVASSFVDPVNGLLVARLDGAGRAIEDLDAQIAKGEDRLEGVEQKLVRQFASLEGVVSGIQQQGNFLSQFLLQNSSR
jgi:flagellar hook-associated protein 2